MERYNHSRRDKVRVRGLGDTDYEDTNMTCIYIRIIIFRYGVIDLEPMSDIWGIWENGR